MSQIERKECDVCDYADNHTQQSPHRLTALRMRCVSLITQVAAQTIFAEIIVMMRDIESDGQTEILLGGEGRRGGREVERALHLIRKQKG